MTSVTIEVTFPYGGHFYGNVHLIVYRQFLRFIHHLTCMTPMTKCQDCLLKVNCRYYSCTGENFQYFPGLIIRLEDFPKTIYQKEETAKFQFFILGNLGQQFSEYIRLFFTSYLEQQIAGTFFYCKKITIATLEDALREMKVIHFSSIVDSNDFVMMYQKMTDYYREHYQCEYPFLSAEQQLSLIQQKRIILEPVQLPTRKIYRKGYIYKVQFQTPVAIPESLLLVGMGRYNFIGGGKIEN